MLFAPKPKTGGEAAQNETNVSAPTPEQQANVAKLNEQQNNEGQSGTEGSTPPPPVASVKQLTAQEKMDAANEKLEAAKMAVTEARKNDAITDEQFTELSLAVFAAKQAVSDAQKSLDVEAAKQAELEKINVEIRKIDTFENNVMVYCEFLASNPQPVALDANGNVTDERKAWLAAAQPYNDAIKTTRDVLVDIVTAKFGKPAATRTVSTATASTGTRGGISAAILAGYKHLRIVLGLSDTEARKQLIDGTYNGTSYNDGTVGNVVKPYKDNPASIA